MSRTAEIEHWKGALLTRPDQLFFELMRLWIGDIQTPFNKQTLIEKLVTHLRNRDTIERILTFITKDDAILLTSIFILNNPDLHTLYGFSKGFMRYLDLHNHRLYQWNYN